MQRENPERDPLQRVTAVAMILGGVVAMVFNGLFPRAEDPWDTAGVLTMMVESRTLRQLSFLGVTAAILALTAGVVGIHRSLEGGNGAVWSRLGLYAVLVGTALFTVSVGLGQAATGAAAAWAAAGSTAAGPEFAVASALNLADDHVWFLSIVTYWGGLGLVGLGMVKGGLHPGWLGAFIMAVGLAAAFLVGTPLAYGAEIPVLLLLFGVLGMATALWALVTGVWTLRRTAPARR